MTELKKIEYAKMFIDKLANGINPLDDMPVREDDVVNNVRLSRCFFFVSDILQQVIEKEKVPKKKKDDLAPFCLLPEQVEQFPYSAEPISISEIARRINMLIDAEAMQKISYRDISNWLLTVNLLYEVRTPEGKTARCPTQQGERLGITTGVRMGEKGEYIATLYSEKAQRLILDNIGTIVLLKYDK